MNRETDNTYLFIDLDKRSKEMNMEFPHFHSSYEIFIALDDHEAHIVDGRYLPMQKWDIIFLRPGLLHQSSYERPRGMQKRIVINFALPILAGSLDYQKEKLLRPFNMAIPIIRLSGKALSSLQAVLEQLLRSAKAKASGWQLEVLSIFMLFLLEVERNMSKSCYESSFMTDTAERKIYNIVEYIQTHYMDNITLSKTADAFAISPYYLSHLFHRVIGIPFITYVHRVKIGHALEMLSDTELKVKEIIESCGFSNASQFNRIFLSFIGMSPRGFRALDYEKQHMVMNRNRPEFDEVVPPAFPPHIRIGVDRRPYRSELLIGIDCSDFDISSPADISMIMDGLDASSAMIDVRKTFPYLQKDFWAISEEEIDAFRSLSDRRLILIDDSDIITHESEDRRTALERVAAHIQFASLISASYIALTPRNMAEYGERDSFALYDSIDTILRHAEAVNIGILITGMADSVLSDPKVIKKMLDYFSSRYLSVLFDPLSMLDRDGSNNTFSYFNSYFSILSEDISAVRLRDSFHSQQVPLGQGIMAKTLPHIAELMTRSVPIIRSGPGDVPPDKDIAYIRKVFGS